MSKNKTETYSISLKDEFDTAACLDVRARIGKIPGVTAMRSVPEGCFGIDMYRVWVDVAPGSAAIDEIHRMPEVRMVKKGHDFG